MRKDVSSVKLPHFKATADMAMQVCPAPKIVRIPLKQFSEGHHNGECEPIVKVGDQVYVGTMIATLSEGIFAPVHSSVSGKVIAIEPVVSKGIEYNGIVIESDEKMTIDPAIKKPAEPKDLSEFLEGVKNSGCVGLGGAAFPTWSKLSAALKQPIKTFLINGAECEPYLTGDNRTMIEDKEYLKKGVALLRKYIGSSEFVIGIEKNKPEAIKLLKEEFADDKQVTIKELNCTYPQGAKQVLLYNVTGLEQKKGTRLSDLGCLIINVTSLVTIAKYFETGMPLVSKCLTVDGNVNKPGNYIVPIGTSVEYVLSLAGGVKDDTAKVFVGGPMMGKALTDLNEPIVKSIGGVIAFNSKQAHQFEPSACIHCGKCVAACPLHLNPVAFAKAMQLDDEQEKLAVLQDEQVALCMECGCCSYVCPAHRHLVQTNHEANAFVKAHRAPRK